MKTNLFVLFFLCFFLTNYAQVGIGTTDPNPAAILDIQSDHAGLLIPRMALTGADDAATIASPVKGLIVYNTAATSTISEGFVFYDGSAWVDLGWQLQGNYAGANSFIGTLNDVPLVFKAENKTIGFLRPNGAVGFGLNSSATAMSSFAIGNGAATNGSRSYALGSGATTSAADAFAIGTNAVADRQNTVILSGVNQNVGIGTSNPQAKFHLSGSFRFEDGNQASGKVLTSDANGTVSWQTPAATSGSGSGWLLTGNNLNGVTNDGSTFLGSTTYNDLFLKVNNRQIGRFSPEGGIALGSDSDVISNNSVAIGYSSEANQDAVALGYNADANGNESIAIGKNSVSNFQNIAIGLNAQSSANNAIAFGNGTTATSQNSIAIGNNAGTQQNESIAVGADSDATGYRSLAIGYNAQASGQNSAAIGFNASAPNANTLILGSNANVGIGTNNPQARFHLENSFRYVDGNQDTGKVLTSDANGNATWQTLAGGTGGTDVYGEIYVGAGYRLSDIDTRRRVVSFGETGPNKGLNSLSNTRIQTREVTGVYKFTYTINLYRRRDNGFLKFYVAEYGTELGNSSSFVDFNNDSEYVTITKSFLVNINNTYRGFDLYMETIDTDDNDEWDDLEVLQGTSLSIELID
ncbi:hypothetical protein [Leeuwenhoekiella nanhaiensis]|uniref:Trimeric autotransporter adhesin YadA-like head domain-containing protein n=1 Tax=Leeuwenhoekiella nanhaiensis TaxID=1655491 RepID=A0A2G1VPV5_9FLAO|nr:hypothetical protein [Leeuwenhoekiella nanhaiensis]PHQ28774.1 hypothetical protein CJ305_13225 [Leeuwenhoekiella nanhaiensis]